MVPVASRKDRQRQEARRRAHLDRVTATSGDLGAQRRERLRDEAARAAGAGASAARWLVARADGSGRGAVPLDVVADLLALDARTRLRGRGDAEVRALAAAVDDLVVVGAVTPSGRTLLEVLVEDAEARDALAPSLSLEALLEGVAPGGAQDRTMRLAEAMLSRAAAHRAGTVDLHALVAPVEVPRHAAAEGIEALVRVATDGIALPASPDPAIVTTDDGWVAVSPVEAFLAASRGLLTGVSKDLLGAALFAWMTHATADPTDPWWMALGSILPVDSRDLLDPAASRAGSDHPAVAGTVLVELIALRYPIG